MKSDNDITKIKRVTFFETQRSALCTVFTFSNQHIITDRSPSVCSLVCVSGCCVSSPASHVSDDSPSACLAHLSVSQSKRIYSVRCVTNESEVLHNGRD